LKQAWQVATDESTHRRTASSRGPNQDNARVALRRIDPHVRDAFVHGQKRESLLPNPLEDDRIRSTGQPFVVNGIRRMTSGSQVGAELNWQVLIKFESHVGRSGSKLSSRASSAA
jgi:hypothetical protein